MPPIRFRIRTLMIVIAVSAVMMSLLRLAPPIFFALLIVVVQVFLLVLVVAVIPRLFAVHDRFIQRRSRQFSRGHSPIRESRTGTKRGVRENVG
jgi:hypothetical protein